MWHIRSHPVDPGKPRTPCKKHLLFSGHRQSHLQACFLCPKHLRRSPRGARQQSASRSPLADRACGFHSKPLSRAPQVGEHSRPADDLVPVASLSALIAFECCSPQLVWKLSKRHEQQHFGMSEMVAHVEPSTRNRTKLMGQS